MRQARARDDRAENLHHVRQRVHAEPAGPADLRAGLRDAAEKGQAPGDWREEAPGETEAHSASMNSRSPKRTAMLPTSQSLGVLVLSSSRLSPCRRSARSQQSVAGSLTGNLSS